MCKTSRALQNKIEFNIACGTNLLHAHMGLVKQWNIGLVDTFYLKPVILFGVGWRSHKKRKTDFYTRWLLKKLLSSTHIHSVRDSYTEEQLHKIGIDNVVNTGCPTIWSLDREHCRNIPVKKAENVVVVLTDYSKHPEHDGPLLNYVLSEYKKVYFWAQGMQDINYLSKAVILLI